MSDSICPTVSDNFFGMDLTDIDKNVACQIWQEIMKNIDSCTLAHFKWMQENARSDEATPDK